MDRISCDDKSIHITANLRDPLLQARHKSKPRSLWIDSICINQQDREEKGLQVALMAEIYSESRCTVIWLGPNDSDAHALPAAGLLADVNAMMDGVLQQENFSWKPDSFPVPDPDEPLLLDPRWESVANLTGQAWFRRCWVVQEAALGPDARILWGHVEMDWLDFLRAYSWVHARASTIHHRVSGNRSISWLHLMAFDLRREQETMMLRVAGHDPSLTMLQVLDCARVLGVTDPRDRVYACLGLPNSSPRPPVLMPNYRKTYLEIYRDFACEYLRSTDMDLDILLFTQHDEETIRDVGFGSWIPRWHLYYCASLFRNNLQPVAPLSSRVPSASRKPFLVNQNTLKVQAVRIGAVRFASDLFQYGSSDAQTIKHVWQHATSTDSGRNCESGYTSRASTLEAVIHTLAVANYNGSVEGWTKKESAYAEFLQSQDGTEGEMPADVSEVHDTLLYTAHNRKFIVADRGYYGLAPLVTCEGDAVYVIIGAKTVFILRGTERHHHYRLVGDTFMLSREIPQVGDNMKPLRFQGGFHDWVSWGLEEEDIFLC